jgi:hypothetical protein
MMNNQIERRQTVYTTGGVRLHRQRVYMLPHVWDILSDLMAQNGETCMNQAITKLILDAHRLSKVVDDSTGHS